MRLFLEPAVEVERRGDGAVVLRSPYPVEAHPRQLGEHLIYTHLHNNHGTTDEHLAFGDGVIDFPEVLSLLRALPKPPLFSLELPNLELIKDSLPFLQLS